MGNIYRPFYSGSGGNDATSFIQCINGREPRIHELWCLGFDGISWKVHPTARVDVTDGTMGEFVTDYPAENGRRINIIGQIFVN